MIRISEASKQAGASVHGTDGSVPKGNEWANFNRSAVERNGTGLIELY
jgi:hypothetical protein